MFHELPFAKIIVLEKDIAEVIINEGIEMTAGMVNEYHEFLLKHLQAPFSLLINKVNSYTYDFDAQLNIANLKQINVMAVVAYNRAAKASTESMMNAIPRETPWKLQIFTTRDQALAWVVSEQIKIR